VIDPKKALRDVLPPVYGGILSEDLGVPAVVETRATCDQCEMCNKGNMPESVEAVYFRPDTKCCTYHPSLANYLVGSILKDPNPEMAEGQRRIRERIASRIGVTPHCLAPPAKYLLLYRASRGSAFGRSPALNCPYLTDDIRCSIWRHRDSVCSTYFCKYDHGQAGVVFWKAFRAYLGFVEITLSMWAAHQIARDIQQPKWDDDKLTLEELEDRAPNEAAYAKTWGVWLGREEEFYTSCYLKVKALSRAQFATIIDSTPKAQELLANLKKAYASMTNEVLPERLTLNKKMRRLPVANGVAITTTYNIYDSMVLEKELFDILERFDHDATVEATRKELADKDGIELADDLMLHLTRHAILVPPTANEGVAEPPAPVTTQTPQQRFEERRQDTKKKKKRR